MLSIIFFNLTSAESDIKCKDCLAWTCHPVNLYLNEKKKTRNIFFSQEFFYTSKSFFFRVNCFTFYYVRSE